MMTTISSTTTTTIIKNYVSDLYLDCSLSKLKWHSANRTQLDCITSWVSGIFGELEEECWWGHLLLSIQMAHIYIVGTFSVFSGSRFRSAWSFHSYYTLYLYNLCLYVRIEYVCMLFLFLSFARSSEVEWMCLRFSIQTNFAGIAANLKVSKQMCLYLCT